MLMTIDAGNTQTVVGLYDDRPGGEGAANGLVKHWRVSTDHSRTADEMAVLLSTFLDFEGLDFNDDISGVSICSGVPRVLAHLRQMCEQYCGFPPVVIEPGVKTGMPILYDNPREVGADRLANAIGAYDLFGGPTVVVDFGTGNNFDIISAAGEFLGGAIAPGIEISMDALTGRAAALGAVALIEPRSVIGKTTVESIQSGAVYGFTDQVDGMVDRFRAELGPSTVVATGGLAHVIAPVSRTIEHVEPFLTLHGLRIVHERNVES
jgi:type III pantothenate kinase